MNKKFRYPTRITFYMVDIFGKSFQMLSVPFNKGDGFNGRLAKVRKLISKMKPLYAGILRQEHGFAGMNLSIKLKYQY